MMYTREPLQDYDRRDGIDAGAAHAEIVRALRNGIAAGTGRLGFSLFHGVARTGRRLALSILQAHERNRAIRELQALDDWLLKDIGIHRGQIPYLVEENLSKERDAKAASAKPRDVDQVADRQTWSACPRQCLGPAS